MAVGKVQHEESIPAGLRFVRSTSALGRKRVALSKTVNLANLSSPCGRTSFKRSGRRSRMQQLNLLEALPEEILVKILCKVNHSDLKQLLLVSKTIRGATLIARESHFAFSTPISNIAFHPLRNGDPGNSNEVPYAPMRERVAKSRLDGVDLSSIAVALFHSPGNE
ncbi:hypothetical protein Cni_G00600 [Canna indica]|uniref:F-box domain-containing protein n=1 Tax=Canna indica TaxID=4628 RepID=A0AAQ3JL67_9LILI|nr:hypothetical protein Cni_G00600 [Canna indica]